MCYDRDCSKKYSERNGRNSKNTAVRLESGMDAVKRLQSEKEENERLTYKEPESVKFKLHDSLKSL